MVVQWEDLKYDSNRAQTFLADPHDSYLAVEPSKGNDRPLPQGVPCLLYTSPA